MKIKQILKEKIRYEYKIEKYCCKEMQQFELDGRVHYIQTEVYLELWDGEKDYIAYHITHCPFCGEKITWVF